MQPSFQNYRQHVDELIQAALAAVDPATAVQRYLKYNGRLLTIGHDNIVHNHYPADGRIYLVSAGKAAVPMALAAAAILGNQLSAGIIIAKKGERDWQADITAAGTDVSTSTLTLYEAGHPVSDEQSIQATTAVYEMLSQTTAHDLVLCLISGGTSALLTRPLISLADWQKLTDVLLRSGCTINELNCVRRQLDEVKGGGLAQQANPATCVSLILSDVVGNPLHVIGSGPTAHSPETLADAVTVLARYQIGSRLETAVWQRVVQALHKLRLQTPPPDTRTHNIIIGDVRQAALAALVKAAQLGFAPQLLTAQLEGEAREVGRFAAAFAKDAPPATCLIMGGETTVTVRGQGKGGRNQEAALAAAIALDGQPNCVIASFATDGEDGPTAAAGAVVTGETVKNGRAHRLNATTYLDKNDSYTYFQQLDSVIETANCHIQTGPSGTNVNDLLFILTYPR
ncbi:MAG: DUF4147 domain-containing protein [Anaerolineales bacterium]|nr:DUF4147 domain-containing protein [Anaerolineales bacterium]